MASGLLVDPFLIEEFNVLTMSDLSGIAAGCVLRSAAWTWKFVWASDAESGGILLPREEGLALFGSRVSGEAELPESAQILWQGHSDLACGLRAMGGGVWLECPGLRDEDIGDLVVRFDGGD